MDKNLIFITLLALMVPQFLCVAKLPRELGVYELSDSEGEELAAPDSGLFELSDSEDEEDKPDDFMAKLSVDNPDAQKALILGFYQRNVTSSNQDTCKRLMSKLEVLLKKMNAEELERFKALLVLEIHKEQPRYSQVVLQMSTLLALRARSSTLSGPSISSPSISPSLTTDRVRSMSAAEVELHLAKVNREQHEKDLLDIRRKLSDIGKVSKEDLEALLNNMGESGW